MASIKPSLLPMWHCAAVLFFMVGIAGNFTLGNSIAKIDRSGSKYQHRQ
jgi:hypothetical protein